MLKSSLLEILRTFSKQELIKFEDFVRSPYFNKKENVQLLFHQVKNFAPDFRNEKLEKENVWSAMFPKSVYNYGIMKNLIFDLNKLAVKFMEIEVHSEKEFDSEINILEQYFSRGLFANFEKKSREIRNCLSEKKPSADLYYQEYILGRKDMSYLYANYTVKNVKQFDFFSLNQSLVLNFFSNLFLLNANINLTQFHFNIKLERDFLESVLDFYARSDFKNYYTEIFYNIFKCSYDQRDDTHYLRLRDLCYENFDKLNDADRRTVLDALIIYCNNKSNTGSLNFAEERFQYLRILDDHNLFLTGHKETIDGYLLLSTIVSACSNGDFDWAENFLEKYRSKLPADESEKFINLSFVHINFKKGNFEDALTHLSRCDSAKGMDKINIKTYEAFLFYELHYYEELKNLVDTSRHFIRNDNTISDEVRVLHGKFIEVVNKLNEYRYRRGSEKHDRSELHWIRNYVSENEMPHKGWINNKLSELEIDQ